MAERFVRTFKQAMKAGCADSLTLQHRLANFLLTFHTTPHATTNEPPCILFLGRSLRTRLDLLGPDRERTVVSSQARQKSQHDLHSHHRASNCSWTASFGSNPRYGSQWLPGRVTKLLGSVSMLVELEDCRVWKRHMDACKGNSKFRRLTILIVPSVLRSSVSSRKSRIACLHQHETEPSNLVTLPLRSITY